MGGYVDEWLQLIVRWVHLITGIAWIGASFYFVWLDNSLKPPADDADAQRGVGGELWAVHGGGFYRVQKLRGAPVALPETLHWFKWEAYWTWISGFALLVLLYYVHADFYLVDRAVADIPPLAAVALSLAVIAGGWVFYDQLCRRLGVDRDRTIAVVMIAFIALVAFALSFAFSGRGLYIEIGAMIGTLMAANVLFVIIPGQKELVAAMEQGRAPDPIHGLRGKQRSVHNNYFTLPVLFIMISNHHPQTWGHPRAWLVLIAILLLAAYVRHFFNLRHRGRTVWAIPVTAALGALALAIVIAPPRQAAVAVPPFAEVEAIIVARCASCHAERPTQPGFTVAPKGVLLDTGERIRASAARIGEQSVTSRAMPIGNVTAMTGAERSKVGAWIAAGAP
jgi:uncharacterized membrane protein